MAVEQQNGDSEMSLPQEQAPLRMAKGQISRSALKAIAGRIMEECNQDLRWPQCITTYKKMAKDATIAPALNLMEMSIAKTNWSVKIPEGYDEQLKDKAEFLRSVQNDMEHSWYEFIRRAATANRYGYAPVEKVYRRRRKSTGSKYNDGYIGIESLPLIDQDSIKGWQFDEAGRRLIGLEQWDMRPTSVDQVEYHTTNEAQYIPRKKFMLFRTDPLKDNPEGNSSLNGIYVAWRFKSELNDFSGSR